MLHLIVLTFVALAGAVSGASFDELNSKIDWVSFRSRHGCSSAQRAAASGNRPAAARCDAAPLSRRWTGRAIRSWISRRTRSPSCMCSRSPGALPPPLARTMSLPGCIFVIEAARLSLVMALQLGGFEGAGVRVRRA